MNITNKDKTWSKMFVYAVFWMAIPNFHAGVLYSKTIRFQNNTPNGITIQFPHFTSITGMDRSPEMTEFKLNPDAFEDIYVKPYQYASSIYVMPVVFTYQTLTG